MAARTRTAKTTTTTTTPAAPAEQPQEQAPASGLDALAASLSVAPELPTVTRGNGGRVNPFTAQAKRSFDENVPLATPPLADDMVSKVEGAIIRGAEANGLGVRIRKTRTDAGTVITFQAQVKQERPRKAS